MNQHYVIGRKTRPIVRVCDTQAEAEQIRDQMLSTGYKAVSITDDKERNALADARQTRGFGAFDT